MLTHIDLNHPHGGTFTKRIYIPDGCQFDVVSTSANGASTLITTAQNHCLVNGSSVLLCLEDTDGCTFLSYETVFTVSAVTALTFTIAWDSTNCPSLVGKGHKPADITNTTFTSRVVGKRSTTETVYTAGTGAVTALNSTVATVRDNPDVQAGDTFSVGGYTGTVLGATYQGCAHAETSKALALSAGIPFIAGDDAGWVSSGPRPKVEDLEITPTIIKNTALSYITLTFDSSQFLASPVQYQIFQQVSGEISVRFCGSIGWECESKGKGVVGCPVPAPVGVLAPADAGNIITEVNIVADLATLDVNGVPTGKLVAVKGYYAIGDWPMPFFRLSATSTPYSLPASDGRHWVHVVGDTVNPRWFGARDGVDDIAIFNMISANFNGIRIEKGDFGPFSASWQLRSNFKVEGIGWESKLTWVAGVNGILLFNDDQVAIRGIHVIGARTMGTNPVNTESGIRIQRCSNVSVESCYIESWGGAGIIMLGGEQLTISKNICFRQGDSDDIRGYGAPTIPNYRIVIEGNYCLSNTEYGQGIAIGLLAADADFVISGNHCIPLDPATCVDGGTWSEMAPAGVVRRHGILIGYASAGALNQAGVCANNTIRNTDWTGIYCNGGNGANHRQIIANNAISDCGHANSDGGDTLMGGIYCAKLSALIIGNLIDGFVGANSPTQTGLSAAIHYRGTSALALSGTETRVLGLCAGNKISNSSAGIAVKDYFAEIMFTDNIISYSTYSDVNITARSGAHGNLFFKNNVFLRNQNDYPSVFSDMALGTKPIFFENNTFLGSLTRAQQATGTEPCIDTRTDKVENCFLIGNHFYQWHSAIDLRTYSTKREPSTIRDNTLKEMTIGFRVSKANATSAGLVPLVGNTFYDVDTLLGPSTLGGVAAGVIATALGNNIHAQGVAVPTSGAWLRGDVIFNSAPAVGSPPSWFCVASGTPGTWAQSPNL